MVKQLMASVVVGMCVVGSAGRAQAQGTPAPQKAAPAALKLNDSFDRPLTWPDSIVLKKAIADSKGPIKAGTSLKLYTLDRQGVVVETPSKELTIVPFDMTDFLQKADEQYAALPDEAKNLTLSELVMRADVLPPTVKLTEDVTFPDKVRKAGREIGPYKVVKSPDGGYQLLALDPETLKKGTINERQTYLLEATDFRQQLKAQFKGDSGSTKPSRLLEELKGRLVDASGKTVPESDKPAKYYALYSTAGWCTWCAKFDPELIKFYNDAKAKGQPVEVIYLTQDKTESDMLEHMTKSGIKYPAVKFDDRLNTPFMLGLISGATPHFVVVTSEGRIVHDGNPAGFNGAEAALGVLKRELAKK